MRIHLQKNWSEQFTFGDKTPGFFVGRDQEIKSLISTIQNNDSSAILISSVRGVGKTSFVHKALSEIKDEIIPFFVNIGHTLSIEDINKNKKKILVSIIRHAYLTDQKDKEIEKLYLDCIGKSVFEKYQSEENEEINENVVTIETKPNVENLIIYTGIFLLGIGIAAPLEVVVRIIICFLGFITFSSKLRTIRTEISKKEAKNIVDDSTDYLEIKFENWLKNKTKKEKKKVVFVIDELDKIDVNVAFSYIKEYKNLFTRSYGHFIFISSEEAYELVNKDRSSSIQDGGIFPTFFTQVYYLPLPSSQDVRNYLNQILIGSSPERNLLASYLLFKSGIDYFELKKIISNYIIFEENNEFCLDTELIENDDELYRNKSELFNWIEKWFFSKTLSVLKSNWKKNSETQKEILKFLNNTYPLNIESETISSESISNLMDFLVDIGHYEARSYTIEDTDGNQEELNNLNYLEASIYYCTNTYNRSNLEAKLTKEDNILIEDFNQLIKVANDLGDLVLVSKAQQVFKNYDEVVEGRDGIDISGIDLFSTYDNYKELISNLEDQSNRITVNSEKVLATTKIIKEQLNNIKAKYYDIFINNINKVFEEMDIYKGFNILSIEHSISNIFSIFPNFMEVISEAYQTYVAYRQVSGKYLLIINNFEDLAYINQGLAVLRNNKNVLVINVITDSSLKETALHPTIFVDQSGRKRKKGMIVDNYYEYKISSIRDIPKVINVIQKFLD